MRNEREPLPVRRQLTHDEEFIYAGYWGAPAQCRVRIFEAPDLIPVVVVTELPMNPGTSITNMAEYLSAEVIAHYLPERFEVDDEESAIWIEHFPRESPNSYELPLFSQVIFSSYRPRIVTMHGLPRVRIGQPQWSHLRHEQVADLLGTPLSP